MKYFKYGKEEINFLKEKDDLLGKAIERIGMIKREVDPYVFSALISSVMSQQISTKAADTVKKRLIDLVGDLRPENIEKTKEEDILSYKDLGIRRGIMKVYGLEDLSKKEFDVYRKRYSPYGTVASLYLWEISAE